MQNSTVKTKVRGVLTLTLRHRVFTRTNNTLVLWNPDGRTPLIWAACFGKHRYGETIEPPMQLTHCP